MLGSLCSRWSASGAGGSPGVATGLAPADAAAAAWTRSVPVDRASPRPASSLHKSLLAWLFSHLPGGKAGLTRGGGRPRDHSHRTTCDSFVTCNACVLDMISGKGPESRAHVLSIETRQLLGYPVSVSLQTGEEQLAILHF